MKQSASLYYIVTTMTGVPVVKEDGSIETFNSREAVRKAAKNRTFKSGHRHHSRGLSKDLFFRAKKMYEQQGAIPLGLLE